jgi:hypothetical protein
MPQSTIQKPRIYYDSEFTGLHRGSTLISIALVSETGNYFYAEFNDYAKDQVNDWIQKHVIDNLIYDKDCLINNHPAINRDTSLNQFNVQIRGSSDNIKKEVINWLKLEASVLDTKQVQIYSDCYAYDWMLLVDLIAGNATEMPDYINYIPIDLSTVLWTNNIDPDISREEFSGISENDVTNFDISLPDVSASKHNCFFDTSNPQIDSHSQNVIKTFDRIQISISKGPLLFVCKNMKIPTKSNIFIHLFIKLNRFTITCKSTNTRVIFHGLIIHIYFTMFIVFSITLLIIYLINCM